LVLCYHISACRVRVVLAAGEEVLAEVDGAEVAAVGLGVEAVEVVELDATGR